MSWQKILAQGFTSVGALLHYLELPLAVGSILAEKEFSTRVPQGFAACMQKGNLHDPLLLQVLATAQELEQNLEYHEDPLVEKNVNPLKGLIHKYHGRVLLTLTGVCAINCRYCFRRHFSYQNNNPGRSGWKDVIQYITEDMSITEIILSGGDPLLASDRVLMELIELLEGIPHVHTLRIHSRVPIVLPERLDASLLNVLAGTQRLKKVVVLHCNHPQELREEVRQGCDALRRVGCTLLNQSVLLANINDNAAILTALSQALFDYGILPYYLHVLDKVKGAAHFDISLSDAQKIYAQLQTLLPGYLLPRLVREEPGALSKTLII